MKRKMYVFLNSPFFAAIATLLTGLLVVVVYKLEKRKEKRDGATIVLMEIRNAENSIRTIKDYGIRPNVSITILPTNSWLKFNHLFVKRFDRDELESLNNFYNQCSLAQREVERLNSFVPIALEEKARVIYPKLLQLAEKYADKDVEYNLRDGSEYAQEREKILATYYGEKEYFLPQQPIDDLLKYVNNIENISVSTAGQKLKKIASIKS